MPRLGRPTVFTPTLIEKIAQCFFDGFTDEETAILCEIDRRTIVRARSRRTEGFCLKIKRAELHKKKMALEIVRNGKGSNWQGMAWFLERRYPTQFARPEIQLSFNNSYTQNNLSISINAGEAKQIEAEAKPVRDAVTDMFQKYRPTPSDGNGDATKHEAT